MDENGAPEEKDPADLLPKHLAELATVLTGDVLRLPTEPSYASFTLPDIESFYEDDRHLTGAALDLHPLLDTETAGRVHGLIPWPSSKRDHPRGHRFLELGASPATEIHLVLGGRMTMCATLHGRRRELAQIGPGQWIGLAGLLKAFDQAEGRGDTWAPSEGLEVEVIALDDARTQRADVASAIQLMRERAAFRAFVEHAVAIRGARRDEILARVRENPLLRFLGAASREYLLGLGALVRAPAERPGGGPLVYMKAGEPSQRAALLLTGEATAYLPASGGEPQRFAARYRPGDLIGHEALVMPGEEPGADSAPPIAEAARRTEVHLAPGSELLELCWYGLRWVLDDKKPIWDRVVRILTGGASTAPLPSIVSVQSAKPGLGATTIAYGLAAALADRGSKVVVVDVQGPVNFDARLGAFGFTRVRETASLQPAPRARRAGGTPPKLTYERLVPPPASGPVRWPSGIDIVWPDDPKDLAAVERLVDLLEAREGIDTIVVSSPVAEVIELAGRLNARSASVLYFTDDPTGGYLTPRYDDTSTIEPSSLTWVYRMTPDYVRREEAWSQTVWVDWYFGDAPRPVRALIDSVSQFRLGSRLAAESFIAGRRVVRIADDAEGMRHVLQGDLQALVGEGGHRYPLGRAFHRLARVVRGTTVGLALGGGGAWGFSHIALIENLEKQGVPIDYVAGTSFGSVVGGLYVGGGMPALQKLTADRSPLGPLTRSIFFSIASTHFLEAFINDRIKAVLGADRTPCLGTTEIPFAPVGTNLGTHRAIASHRSTVGFGVRMSGSMPPVFPSLPRLDDRIVDGAFVANVPSRVVRDMGACFVIASNVVPPTPQRMDGKTGGFVRELSRWGLGRIEQTVRAAYVLAWRAGADQGEIAADYSIDLAPEGSSMLEMWKGKAIVDQIRARSFAGGEDARIRNAWLRFCARKRG